MFQRGKASDIYLSLILLTFYVIGCVKGLSSGDVRLIAYDTTIKFPTAGRLEVYVNYEWGTVCNHGNSFNQMAADVVCKQLGFSVALEYGRVYKLGFSQGSGNVAMVDVNCSSSAFTRLTSCRYTTYPSSQCSHYYDDIAVSCRHTGDRIRLVSWSGRSDNISAGRLEVLQDYQWGTICSQSFTSSEATVACRQLGFSDYLNYGTTPTFNLPSASYDVSYLLSGLSCQSTESTLFDCPRYSDSYYSCYHYDDDTALSCIGTGALRLVDYYTSSAELPSAGRLEIYLKGSWGTIDYSGVSYTEAKLACKQLGFSDALNYGSVGSVGYYEASYSTPMWLSDLSCYYYSDTLLDCTSQLDESGSFSYDHSSDLALKCDSPGTTTTYDYYSSGLSFGAIMGIVMGSLFVCSFLLVLISLICVCVACARVNKRRSRRCVQRNVVEESSPHGYTACPTGYPGSFSSPRLPPPPYSAMDVHAEGRERQATLNPGQYQASASSMHPVVNFPENYTIEHEAFHSPASVVQPGIAANTDHVTFSTSDVEDSNRLSAPFNLESNNEHEGESGDLDAEGSSSSFSEDRPLISDTH